MKIEKKDIIVAMLLVVLSTLLLLPATRTYAEANQILYTFYLMALACTLSYLLVPFMIVAAFKTGLVDAPDELRKTHACSTPLTGGAAIYTAFAITILVNFHFSIEMKAILFSSSLIFFMGLADDKWGLSAKLRLAVQLIATLILVMQGVRITFVPDWLGGVYVEYLLTTLWIVGITNSMNFIDGMDGLASGTCIIYSIFFGIIAAIKNQHYMLFLAIAIAGSCLGFFPHNFRNNKPARIFLGDSGSTFLGFLLASFAILGEWGSNILDLAVPVLIMSVLIFDMCLTTIVRISSGEVKNFSEWLHYTGRDHFHHRLRALGLSQKQAALMFFSVSVCFGLQALSALFASTLTSWLILVHTILVFVILGSILVLKTGKGTARVTPIEKTIVRTL